MQIWQLSLITSLNQLLPKCYQVHLLNIQTLSSSPSSLFQALIKLSLNYNILVIHLSPLNFKPFKTVSHMLPKRYVYRYLIILSLSLQSFNAPNHLQYKSEPLPETIWGHQISTLPELQPFSPYTPHCLQVHDELNFSVFLAVVPKI